MDTTPNNPAETTHLLNAIDSAFAGIDFTDTPEDTTVVVYEGDGIWWSPRDGEYMNINYSEEVGMWFVLLPAGDDERPYDDVPEGIGGDHPTTNDTTHRPYTCTCCGLDTDEVGPLCPIGGRWYGMCEECYADNRADEDFAEQGGYD